MRILGTADWQTQWSNLHSCEIASQRVLGLCVQYHLEVVVVAGDIKHQYNPIDLRVIQFWMDFIKKIKQTGAVPLLLLGNHDRGGLYDDRKNWLPILEAAGARIFWETGIFQVPSGGSIYVFPFMGTKERMDQATTWLEQQKPKADKDILVFHQTLKGSMFNKLGAMADGDGTIPLAAIQPERFRYCLGGDIHLPQRVAENVWYVGSPFPMDWGEVNQTKVFAIVTEKGLEWVSTGMPGWYDPEVKGYKEPKVWKGCRIRIRVPVVKGEDYGQKLATAKLATEKKYPGVQVTALPGFQELMEGKVGSASVNKTEHEQIVTYIKESIPAELEDQAEAMVSFVEYKLKQTGQGLRLDNGVRFRKAWAEKFLSFDSLELDFTREGITVVSGVNKDRPGKSVGSGKTNILQLIPVALFGRTFKGQSHDGWVQRGSTGTSRVGVEFELADGSVVKVERTRRPVSVHLWVNGNEISAGGKSMDVSKDIETLSGYTWDTFTTLIYMSSQEVEFLWGTQKQKQEIIGRLQNSERFGLALKLVYIDTNTTERIQQDWKQYLEQLNNTLTLQAEYNEAGTEIDLIEKEQKKTRLDLLKIPTIHKPEGGVYRGAKDRVVFQIGQQNGEIQSLTQRIDSLKALGDICSRCGQKIKQDQVKKDLALLNKDLVVKKKNIVVLRDRLNEISVALVKQVQEFDKQVQEFEKAKQQRQNLTDRLEELDLALARWKEKQQKHETESQELQAQITNVVEYIQGLEEDIKFLRTAEAILSRDGLSAYLNTLVCPRLNQVARYFSDLFTDGEYQLLATMEDGELDIQVVNPHGGLELLDQSHGEGRMFGIVASFALRELAPKAGLLILDEPGDGLDSASAHDFAVGIKNMKLTGQVFVMTHNPNIESELAGEHQLLVEKENGVSQIVLK